METNNCKIHKTPIIVLPHTKDDDIKTLSMSKRENPFYIRDIDIGIIWST